MGPDIDTVLFNWVNNWSISGPVNVVSSDTTQRYRYRKTDGYDIENYRARKARGELLPQTPFNQLTVDCQRTLGWALAVQPPTSGDYIVNQDYSNYFFGNEILTEDNAPSLFPNELPDRTMFVQAAAARIYASGHDTATFLAELGSVKRMFRGLVTKIHGLLRGKPQGTPANYWLELRYGWRPLAADIQQLNEAIQNLNSKRRRWSQNSGRSISYIDTNTFDIGTSSGVNYTRTTISKHYEISVRGSVVADIEPPTFRFNLITTAWELIPLSFVVDWFWNVGQSLEALSFLVFSTNYTASEGYRVQLTHEQTSDLLDGTGSNWIYSGQSKMISKFIWENRRPTTVSTFPQFSVNLDEYKILDLISLMVQRLT
jgi:hypothetical protein